MEKLIYDIRTIFGADLEDNVDESHATSSALINELSGREKAVRKVLDDYKSNPIEWWQYAQFDPLLYTRNLVDIVDGKYNLLILCWGPRQFSQIHDHTDSHCFVKVLQGKLLETRYAFPQQEDQPLLEIGSDMYHVNEVTYINDEIGLHRMENDSHTDGTITLHLYSPPLEHCQVFDLRTGRRDHVYSTYYTKYGEKVGQKLSSNTETTKSIIRFYKSG